MLKKHIGDLLARPRAIMPTPTRTRDQSIVLRLWMPYVCGVKRHRCLHHVYDNRSSDCRTVSSATTQ
jgi:hypothetical protein